MVLLLGPDLVTFAVGVHRILRCSMECSCKARLGHIRNMFNSLLFVGASRYALILVSRVLFHRLWQLITPKDLSVRLQLFCRDAGRDCPIPFRSQPNFHFCGNQEVHRLRKARLRNIRNEFISLHATVLRWHQLGDVRNRFNSLHTNKFATTQPWVTDSMFDSRS